ncbi:MAG TPA: tetratricopeptide repeat protein [Chitinophagaceae bacterium]|nr:tetratricopeptide repeat protein [Chitinophagaceae bacterium]
MKRLILTGFLLITLTAELFSQEALKVDVDKPEKFENKRLGYEKTGEKKFTIPRRFMQNTTTHYNYYFNANAKLNEIVARSKAGHKDDFTTLLPFYSYNLEQTSQEKQELDSVIYKVTTGILIHDLRNNWLDDMYMLMGKAFYYRNQLDSAWQTFQYINYAFSPKESDGYDKVIGSNQNEGGSALSISTKEKRNIVKKAFTEPPSRNESFIWQIRTYIQQNELPQAAGLIETLRTDPNFPARLRTDLDEVQAFWYYRQNMYDSAAKYLDLALDNAQDKNELARWEYLIAQMYERTGKKDEAQKYYAKAIKHTFNPVLEVYARLNSLRQSETEDAKSVQNSIAELVKMARRDKYFDYRDLIYYTAAQMELDRKNYAGAKELLLKSIKFSTNNPDQKNQTFLQLADLAFSQKDFASARSFYDSVTSTDPFVKDIEAYNSRKQALANIVVPSGVIYRQDSLQKIAAMPEKEREAYVRKLVRQLRKSQGLKDEVFINPSSASTFNNVNAAPVDLFNNADKGVWYFDNASLKSKGYNEFRLKWGNRPNVDNWRRITAVTQSAQAKQSENKVGDVPPFAAGSTELSYEALSGKLPTTVQMIQVSNDSIEIAMMQLGRAFQEDLEEYQLAIDTYENFLSRYPNTAAKQEAYFNLYYSYWKLKNQAKADYYKNLLQQQFPSGKYDNALNPEKLEYAPDSVLKKATTVAYEGVYNSFISGDFEKAISDKRSLDSMYGRKFWTPQLSYIEALYYIRQRNDSTAKLLLADIIYRFNKTAMYEKAQTMLDVLNRRKEIEDYLTNLKVERVGEESVVITEDPLKKSAPAVITQNKPVEDANKIVQQPIKSDSVQKIVAPPHAVKSGYSFDPLKPQLVMIVIENVDPVYVTETRNAFNRYNKEKYYNKVIEIVNIPIDEKVKLVVLNNFASAAEAIEYVEKARNVAGGEIVPWLPKDRYSFYIISAENLELLKASKDVKAYKDALILAFPGKF